MQELHDSQDPHGVLGGEGREEPRTGPGGVAGAGGEGLERGDRLGMPVEEGGP